MEDCHGAFHTRPPEDEHQDLHLLSYNITNDSSYKLVKFMRKLNTNDSENVVLKKDAV